MRIHSFSKILGLPLAVLTVVIAYVSYDMDGYMSAWIFLPVILMVAIYVFHGPLDHWWLTKYPIPFDPRLKDWLLKFFPFYKNLNEKDREIFEYRMTLYLDARLFKSVGAEQRDVPEDIKCMIAAHGILMALHHKDYLIGDMDRIFVYKHPFPTPEHPYLHNVEIHVEDGVIILSLEQLTNSILHPKQYFNTAFYAYAAAFTATQKKVVFPQFSENSWTQLEDISGFSKDMIHQHIGLKTVDLTAVHITVYFVFRDRYATLLPEYFPALEQIFNSSAETSVPASQLHQ